MRPPAWEGNALARGRRLRPEPRRAARVMDRPLVVGTAGFFPPLVKASFPHPVGVVGRQEFHVVVVVEGVFDGPHIAPPEAPRSAHVPQVEDAVTLDASRGIDEGCNVGPDQGAQAGRKSAGRDIGRRRLSRV